MCREPDDNDENNDDDENDDNVGDVPEELVRAAISRIGENILQRTDVKWI